MLISPKYSLTELSNSFLKVILRLLPARLLGPSVLEGLCLCACLITWCVTTHEEHVQSGDEELAFSHEGADEKHRKAAGISGVKHKCHGVWVHITIYRRSYSDTCEHTLPYTEGHIVIHVSTHYHIIQKVI